MAETDMVTRKGRLSKTQAAFEKHKLVEACYHQEKGNVK